MIVLLLMLFMLLFALILIIYEYETRYVRSIIYYILVGSQHTIILAGRDFVGVFQKLMTMVSAL